MQVRDLLQNSSLDIISLYELELEKDNLSKSKHKFKQVLHYIRYILKFYFRNT